MKRIGQFSALIIVAVFAMVPLSSASAQQGGVAVLITEVVGEGIGAEEPGPRFWWSGGSEPSWTASDRLLFETLISEGVEPFSPQSVNISRIYRRPHLPLVNGAQLGGLLGADRVLVGTITYRPMAPTAPLRLPGIIVEAEVELTAAGATDGVSLQRYTVSREVYGEFSTELLTEAKELGTRALGEVLGRSLRRTGGEVGSLNLTQVLALRNVQSAANLDAMRRRLLDLDEVESVVERWASEGIIALEINPGSNLSPDLFEYVIRVLENHSFDDFQLQRSPRPVVNGTAEFWVEPRGARF